MIKPIDRLLVSVDFSDISMQALKQAYELSQKLKAKLFILHVLDLKKFEGHFFSPLDPQLIEKMEKQAELKLSEFTTQANIPLDAVSLHLRTGLASKEITRFAKEQKIQLLLMGSEGKSGLKRFLIGSVAETVIQKAECSLWVIKDGSLIPPQKILILSDLSLTSDSGIHMGIFLSKLFHTPATLVYVFEPLLMPDYNQIYLPDLEMKLKEASEEEFQKKLKENQSPKLKLDGKFKEGLVKNEILNEIKEGDYSLVVLSSRGQGGSLDSLGSIANTLLRHSPIPVVIVK